MLQEFNLKKLRHCRNAKISPQPGNLWLRHALPQLTNGNVSSPALGGPVPLRNAWLQPSSKRKPATLY